MFMGTVGLTAKGLNLLNATMCTIPDHSMNLSVCDPEVWALVVWTGEALRVYPFQCSPPTFDLAPGVYSRRYRLYK